MIKGLQTVAKGLTDCSLRGVLLLYFLLFLSTEISSEIIFRHSPVFLIQIQILASSKAGIEKSLNKVVCS